MSSKPRFVRLGEVVKASRKKNKDGAVSAVYSVTNSRGFVPSEDYFSKEVFSKELRTYRVVERGSIAYNPSRINVGSVALQDKEDAVIISPLYVVFSVDRQRILPEYAVRFLKSKPGLGQIACQSIGTVRNNLKFDALCRLELMLPSLDEQKRALAILRSVEREIEGAQETLDKLDSLAKSRFAEMFKRAECLLMPLEDCVESIDSGKSPACQSVSREGSMPGVLKLSALSSGRYLEEENKALLPDEVILPAKEVMTGDILMTRKNTPELVGKSVLVKKTAGNVMFPDLVFRMHPADGMDGTYLAGALSGPLFNSIREMAHGSAKSMSNIPKGELRKLPVPVPPLSLQQEFAAFAEQADKSAFVANRQGLLLDALTRAIAVRGYTQGESENHGPTCVYSLMEMRI